MNGECYINIAMKLGIITLLCLHHKYDTPFIKVILEESIMDYKNFIDHSVISATFGNIDIYDMLGYPSEVSPLDFKHEKMSFEEINKKYSFEKLLGSKPPQDKENFNMHIYNSDCPIKAEKENRNFTRVEFGEIWAVYIQELSFRRVVTYMLQQLLYSLSPFDALCFF